MKRILLSLMMLFALLLPHSPALAEDVLCLTPSDYASADVEDAQYRAAHLTMTTSYVCFTGDLAEEGNVSLTITREETQETVAVYGRKMLLTLLIEVYAPRALGTAGIQNR